MNGNNGKDPANTLIGNRLKAFLHHRSIIMRRSSIILQHRSKLCPPSLGRPNALHFSINTFFMKTHYLLCSLLAISIGANAQNVGIGITNPTATLDVNGTLKVHGGSPGSGKVLTSDAAGLATWSTAGVVQPGTFIFSENSNDANLIANGYTNAGSINIDKKTDNTTTTLPDVWTRASRFLEARLSPAVINGAGNNFIVFGGSESGSIVMNGGIYDPQTDNWIPIPDIGDGIERSLPVVAWCANKLVVWGGSVSSAQYTNTGKVYDPATQVWTSMSLTNAPSARWLSAFAYNPGTNELAIWGGEAVGGAQFGDGAKYNLNTNTWTTMNSAGAPSPRSRMAYASNGAGLLFIAGGYSPAAAPVASAHLYNIAANNWTSLSSPLSARYNCIAAWTGSAFIFWGGRDNSNLLNDGALYNPASTGWAAMSNTNAPASFAVRGAYGNGVFAVCGSASNARYTVATNTWTALADEPRFSFDMAGNSLCLFVAGGTASATIGSVLIRDAARYFWTPQQINYKTSVPTPFYLYRKN